LSDRVIGGLSRLAGPADFPGGGARAFALPAPEGNYVVALELGSEGGRTSTTVWAETRRLMVEEAAAEPGERLRRRIAVNLRSPLLEPPPLNAPGGGEVALGAEERGSPDWDGILSLEFEGPAPGVLSVEVEAAPALPTLYLAGDSTVTDQPRGAYASWGQMLPRWLTEGVAVANHAHSGETLKSFASSLRLAKVLERMKAGDYLMIQFGHNDQKREWPQTYAEAGTTYKAYLRAYIAEARLRGAIPILATSPQRRKFGPGGRIENTHGAYPDAVREIASEQGLFLVDLEEASRSLLETLGPELSRAAFAVPGDETHNSPYGANQLAKCVARSLRGSGLPLADWVSADLGDYDPSRPDAPTAAFLERLAAPPRIVE
jgi:lysophospholipase L1-like esterase